MSQVTRRTAKAGLLVTAVVAVLAGLLSPFTPVSPASAADGTQFDPGYIISDDNFFDGTSLTSAEIQSFLNGKVSACISGYTCLKDYRQDTPSMSASSYCSAYSGGANDSAADIIYKVGVACGVSPKVLIVLLEKEQSLVTSTSPSTTRYTKATGFACPDTAPCDASYGGFFYQVYNAARQFKVYSSSPTYNWFPVGKTSNVLYNPNAACGSSPVVIRNKATAGLYYYTPYQPNTAALAKMYGIGDSCSAYGNRNFWRLFSDWFGSPTGPLSPVGSVDSLVAAPGGIRVTGWALDLSVMTPIAVHIYVDGVGRALTADQPRADVARFYNRVGVNNGFSVVVPASPGTHQVCVYGINQGYGANSLISCHKYTVGSGSPIGSPDAVEVVGQYINISGWALDPNTADPIQVHAYIDGAGAALMANTPRSDIGRVYPDYGAGHGFSYSAKAGAGNHSVCLYAINVGDGSNTTLGCRTVNVVVDGIDHGRSPIGNLDVVTAAPGLVTLSGWSLDQDDAAPITVTYTVNGVAAAGTVVANTSRRDIVRVVPGYGPDHGFTATTEAPPGQVEVCAFGVNSGTGSARGALGCRTITVPAMPPVGVLDVVEPAVTAYPSTAPSPSPSATPSSAGIHIRGWAFAPLGVDPISVHVYVDGGAGGVAVISANQSRPDVDAAYAAAVGPSHGYDAVISASSGKHRVCVYGVDSRALSNTTLGCRTVTIP